LLAAKKELRGRGVFHAKGALQPIGGARELAASTLAVEPVFSHPWREKITKPNPLAGLQLRGWCRSRRLSVTPLDKVAAIRGAIRVLVVGTPKDKRLEKMK